MAASASDWLQDTFDRPLFFFDGLSWDAAVVSLHQAL